jgi:hypothetical protein
MTQPAIHRLIEGGNATFTAGCELATLHLNPVVGITSKVSMKADANTILITWRPTADSPPALLKGLLESVGGSLRFCHRATRGQRDKWQATTVAGFYHPEHAHAALKYMKGSLWLKGQQLYTVYITAPKDVSAAVLIDIEEIASQTDVDIAWEEPRQGKVTLRLSGTDKDAVVDMKGVTEAIFSGHIATTWSTCTSANSPSGTFEIWHDFFATAPGEIWIKYLERETGTLIRSDKLQQRLRSYSSGENSVHCSFIDQELRSQLEKLEDSQERQAIPLDTKQFRALVASDRVALAQRRLSKENVSLDLLNKTLVLHCSRKTAWLITHELGLAMPPPAPAKAEHECFHCGETTTDVKLSCGHVNCRECFDHQLHVASTDLTGNHFPLVCWHEICKEPIPIADLRKHTTGTTFDNLLKASLTYYVRSSPHKYRNCRTPDCKSVYLLQSSYEIFTCPTCLTQTCEHLPIHAMHSDPILTAHLRYKVSYGATYWLDVH